MLLIDPDTNTRSVRMGRWLLGIIQHWNSAKYFRRREYVIDPNRGVLVKKFLFLIWIKRIDTYHNCSFGTNINNGAKFSSPPQLPHGPNGIIVGHSSAIGKNVRIFQQVTIAAGATVGDNCIIGAGAKVLEGRHVGNNVKVGANCVVVEDVPDGCTVVLTKPRILNY